MVVKPKIDVRTQEKIVSRQKGPGCDKFEPKEELEAKIVGTEEEFRELIIGTKPEVIGIDEAQFFGKWLPGFLNLLMDMISSLQKLDLENGRSSTDLLIIAAGLDMDAWQRPFAPMPDLMAMADDVRKETAVCFKCHGKYGLAIFTQKRGGTSQQVEVGDANIYEARCRVCFTMPEQPA